MTIFKNMISTMNECVDFMLPSWIPTAIQEGLQDPRIRKIVGGASMAITGMYLLSAPTRTLISWVWTRKLPKGTSKIALCLRAGAGLGIAGYGIYSVVVGCREFSGSTISLNHANQRLLDSPGGQKLSSCTIQLNQAKQKLLACPAGQKLWDENVAHGPFSLRCSDEPMPREAQVRISADQREILLMNWSLDKIAAQS